jgi:hypothetical protein
LCMSCAILGANTKFLGVQHEVPTETCCFNSDAVHNLYADCIIYVGHWVPRSFTAVAYILNINLYPTNAPSPFKLASYERTKSVAI